MATYNAYRSAQGWIITATVNGREMYLQVVRNGEYRFCRDSLYAKTVTARTASKYLSALTGLPFLVNDRDGKMDSVVKAMMKKGWSNDESILIAERIFRQYESNVMGMSVQEMVRRQPAKAECI